MTIIRPGVAPTVTALNFGFGQSLEFEKQFGAARCGWLRIMRAEGGATVPSAYTRATNGSAMLLAHTASPGVSWWNETSGSAGTLLTDAVAQVAGRSIVPTSISVNQGQQDADEIVDVTTKAAYKTGLQSCIAALRAEIGSDVPVVIEILGRREIDGNHDGWRWIREAHFELVSGVTNATGCQTYDLDLRDSVHPTQDGYFELGARSARALLGDVGPARGAHSVSGNTLSIPITDPEGRGLLKPAIPAGFTFRDGAAPVAPTGWAWSGDTLQVTFAASPVGLVCEYIAGTGVGLDTSAVIREATGAWPSGVTLRGLPLQWFPAFTV